MPKRRAASRWLSPSTWQAWRTRPYSSTENIPALSGPWCTSPKKAMTRYSFVPARPDYPVAAVAHFRSAALTVKGFLEGRPFRTDDAVLQPDPKNAKRHLRQIAIVQGRAQFRRRLRVRQPR